MFPIHHVLPQYLASHPVINFLADRFDIDGIRNRMALPATQGLADDFKSSPHTGGHLGSYYDGFSKYLDEVDRSDSFKASVAGRQWQLEEVVSDLNKLLAAAKYAQANGHLFATTPTGMTREQANGANKEWFSNWRRYAEDNEEQIQQMQETIDQLNASGKLDSALHWPILSPTSALGLADRIDILRRYPDGSPISRQFTVVGPVPALPGLVPSFVDTRLPGFIPISPGDLKQPEGFTPSNPLLTYGLRGFPALDPDWQRRWQTPPSTAAPPDPQVLQFHSETGQPLRFLSDLSPVTGPAPPVDREAALWAGMAVLGAGALLIPGVDVVALGAALLAAAAATTATRPAFGANFSSGAGFSDGSVFSKSAAPYSPFTPDSLARGSNTGSGSSSGFASAPLIESKPLDQEPNRSGIVGDRFGTWTETPAGTMPAQPPSVPDAAVPSAAGAVAPEEVRRLTRVNASNAGSVFEAGSSPVPYLPSPEFNDRFGNWSMPTEGLPQQASRPVGAFNDEPSYVIPPPIWGSEDPGNPQNDAEEWFSRWIRPLLRQE